MLPIQATISGFKGGPTTVYSVYDEESDILTVARIRSIKKKRAKPDTALVTNIRGVDCDGFFEDEDFQEGLKAYFEFKNGLAGDDRSSRLVFSPQAGNISIENSVQVEGMDEKGLRYSFNGEMSNEQVAILATCLFVKRQAGQDTAIDAMRELDNFQRELDAGFIITI